ncbi:MAG: OmpH family outer membrane protein [Bacteroidetes bacterium]|nr:OmpH family outer membrane protein [Bacteroidota bacterium]
MKKLLLLFIAIVFTQCITHVFAQTKIGYINVDEIFALMPETRKADSTLAIYQKELADAYAEQETELNAAIEKFIKDSITMTAVAKEAKRSDLQTRVSGMSKKKQGFNDSFEKEKDKQIKPIQDKLLATIKAVAKENGYGHVLYKDQAIVFPETDDITSLVKKKLGIK